MAGGRSKAKSPCFGLPVLQPAAQAGGGPRHAAIRKSRSAPRRAAVLIGVHLVFLTHLTHWWLKGRTLSPVEPSEAMFTLELGHVNAGFIFFGLAILSTVVFGRIFCGWGCHIVALQDLAGALMKKLGVRPQLFRSRLMAFGPLALALYMFVWPTFKREVLGAAPPFPGFTNHLITETFWDTFPNSYWVAIPFLLICGFAAVYFLGAKGFCTYGCPYGAVFGAMDRVAAGQILADLSVCEKCGHCTARCTSNVRVHEEIQLHGKVVDPGCMKCMDCVSVCPTGALSFGFAKPKLFGRARRAGAAPPKRFDLTWGEEVFLGAAFLGAFLAWRGAYQVIPLLMSIGVAACLSFVLWKMWRLLKEREVRLLATPLKREGRWRAAGRALWAGGALLWLLTAHTGVVQAHLFLGERWDHRVAVSRQEAFDPRREGELSPALREASERALSHYRRAAGLRQGGLGLHEAAEIEVRLAWLHVVRGERGEAIALLSNVAARGKATPALLADLGELLAQEGRVAESIQSMERAWREGGPSARLRDLLGEQYLKTGRAQDALTLYRDWLASNPGDVAARVTLAKRIHLEQGRPDEALVELRRAVELAPREPWVRHDLAVVLFFLKRDPAAGLEEMEAAARLAPADSMLQQRLGEMRELAKELELSGGETRGR
jgi:polyferredoxin/Flp pilus assembly protein TadD